MLNSSMCCLCFKEEESLDHLFLHCLFTRKAWNTLFRIFYLELYLPSKSIVGWLKGSTLEVIARKETSYGDVLSSLFCGAFGKKGTVEFFKIAIILLILFGLCCNTQPLGEVWITPNTFVIVAFLWFSTIRRPSFFSFLWGGPSCPLPLGCSLLLYEYPSRSPLFTTSFWLSLYNTLVLWVLINKEVLVSVSKKKLYEYTCFLSKKNYQSAVCQKCFN